MAEPSSVLNLTKETEVRHVWFVALGPKMDILAVVQRDSARDPWYAIWRIRYPDDSKDVFEVRRNKNGTQPSVEQLVQEMVLVMHGALAKLRRLNPDAKIPNMISAEINAIGQAAMKKMMQVLPVTLRTKGGEDVSA